MLIYEACMDVTQLELGMTSEIIKKTDVRAKANNLQHMGTQYDMT